MKRGVRQGTYPNELQLVGRVYVAEPDFKPINTTGPTCLSSILISKHIKSFYSNNKITISNKQSGVEVKVIE